MIDLESYIFDQLSAPWCWGGEGPDCILQGSNWISARRGVDPAAAYRPLYHDLRGAHRLIKRAGGIVALVSTNMAAAGFQETSEPDAGDVGLVVAATALRDGKLIMSTVGAICVGQLWAVRGVDSLTISEFEVVKAWRV